MSSHSLSLVVDTCDCIKRSLRFGSADVVVQPLEEVQQTDNESSDVLWKYSFSFVAK